MSNEQRDRLLKTINYIYHEHTYSYIIGTYIDREYWTYKIVDLFPESSITNLTDYNYATCFDYLIYCTPTMVGFASKAFHEFLREHTLVDVLRIRMSLLAPYADLKYGRYTYADPEQKNGASHYEESELPYQEQYRSYDDRARVFLEKEAFEILGKDVLSIEVPDISLELKSSHVTIYDCLFEQ